MTLNRAECNEMASGLHNNSLLVLGEKTMERNFKKTVTVKMLLAIAAILLSASQATAITADVSCSADAFVYNPGENAGWSYAPASTDDGAGNNFGASGSLSVASATTTSQEGEFISLLRFDFSEYAGQTVSAITLTLQGVIYGNSSANGIFNNSGCTGNFDVSMLTSDWIEGIGAPHLTVTEGITYNSLMDLLSADDADYLDTFYYDGGTGTYTFTFDLTSDYCQDLLDAVYNCETVSLMLAASSGSDVAFNFSGKSTSKAYVTMTVPEPATMLLLAASSVMLRRRKR